MLAVLSPSGRAWMYCKKGIKDTSKPIIIVFDLYQGLVVGSVFVGLTGFELEIILRVLFKT